MKYLVFHALFVILLFSSTEGFLPRLQHITSSKYSNNNKSLKISHNFPMKHYNSRPLKASKNHINQVKKMNIPNMLTVGRVIAIPIFILAFALKLKATAFGIYVLSCITDLLDGYLARKWNQTSAFGAFLDPVADKLMVGAALVLLTSQFPTLMYILPVTLIMIREIGISALREWMAEKGKRETVQVGKLGKLKTTVQMISTILLLLVIPDASHDIDLCKMLNISKPMLFSTGIVSLYISMFLTVYSGFEYLIAAWPILFENNLIRLPKSFEDDEELNILQ